MTVADRPALGITHARDRHMDNVAHSGAGVARQSSIAEQSASRHMALAPERVDYNA